MLSVEIKVSPERSYSAKNAAVNLVYKDIYKESDVFPVLGLWKKLFIEIIKFDLDCMFYNNGTCRLLVEVPKKIH